MTKRGSPILQCLRMSKELENANPAWFGPDRHVADTRWQSLRLQNADRLAGHNLCSTFVASCDVFLWCVLLQPWLTSACSGFPPTTKPASGCDDGDWWEFLFGWNLCCGHSSDQAVARIPTFHSLIWHMSIPKNCVLWPRHKVVYVTVCVQDANGISLLCRNTGKYHFQKRPQVTEN